MATRLPSQPALTPRQQVAARVAAAIFAGHHGEAIMDTHDRSVLEEVATTAFEFADIFLAAGNRVVPS